MRKVLYVSLLVALWLVACREPNPLEYEPEVHPERVSVAYLKSFYRTAPVCVDGAVQIEGHIIANDFNGNLYNELCVADSTGGIIVRLDADSLYRRFREGARVAVRCNGLWLGSSGGTIELGAAPTDEYEVDPIPTEEIGFYLSTDTMRQIEIVPRSLTIAECAPEYVSTRVLIERVQFIEEELPLGWCDRVIDSLSGEPIAVATVRHLVDPRGDTIDVYTSPYADFVQVPLPSGSGSVEGLLGYFNRRYQLRILSSYHIVLTDARF